MKRAPQPRGQSLPPVQTEFFAFSGGLDLVSPPLTVPAGKLLDGLNYEPSIVGGYSRIAGYERFDGRPRPADSAYYALSCTMTTALTAGDALTIGAATCVYLQLITGGILVSEVVGTIAQTTAIKKAGATVGTTATGALQVGGITGLIDGQYMVAAAANRRSAIAAVPGSGPVRGVWLYKGVTYAFRDNAGGTAGVMFKSTSAGWQAITLPWELGFNTGTAGAIGVGETVKGMTSSATGVVRAVALEKGAWGAAGAGAASGRLIIDTISGTFVTGEPLRSSVDAYATARATSTSPVASRVTISPGGSYQFTNFNFYGQVASLAMYGVNGVDRAFQFDGTTFTPIRTGAASDKPSLICAHMQSLWVGLESSALFSVPGSPMCWDASLFAGEIAFGDTLTAMMSLPGQTLAVYTRFSTHSITGTSAVAGASQYVRQTIAAEAGAIRNTLALLIDPYVLDDRGIVSAYTSQNYGNFEYSTCSRAVQPLINTLQGKAVGAVPLRQKNQYRLFYNDGHALAMYVDGSEARGAKRAFALLQYPFTPACVCSVEDLTGAERVFVGDSTGYVYEMERGSTFDGAAIEAFIKVWYFNNGSPTVRKRYRRLNLEMTAQRHAELRMYADYSFGDPASQTFTTATIGPDGLGGYTFSNSPLNVDGAGGTWDVSSWDAMYWDAQAINSPTFSMTGTGTNLSLVFYSNTMYDSGHTLQGVVLHYSPRRLQR